MSLMIAFGWASIMLLIGIVLRAKVKFFGNILMPAGVIGGLIGLILVNTPFPEMVGIDPNIYTQTVNFLFTISFISIGLTAVPKSEDQSTAKEVTRGSLSMGLVWCAMYGFTPLVGYGVVKLVGGFFDMAPVYGLMIPFAFCQGPGQSVNFGTSIEANGWVGATQVGITYAVVGFIMAFLVGVPLAKYGIKKGLAHHSDGLSPAIQKGIYKPEEQTAICGKVTTYNGNVDVLALHVALIGICFIGSIYLGKALMMIPISFIQILASMQFMMGLFVAYFVRWVMEKLNVKQYHDDTLQTRITGFATDYLIIMAFMAVQFSIVGKWIIPIVLVCLVVGALSLACAIYFGARVGGSCDFERTLGLWGCLTGTCPTGVALVRIVDPHLKTTAATEMGSMNIIMSVSTVIVPFIIGYTASAYSFSTMLMYCLGMTIIALVLMKVCRVWGKPTYKFFG